MSFEDATWPARVTREEIRRGRPGWADWCPVSLALQKVTGEEVSVYEECTWRTGASRRGERVPISLAHAEGLTRWIHAFDATETLPGRPGTDPEALPEIDLSYDPDRQMLTAIYRSHDGATTEPPRSQDGGTE